VRQSVQKKCRSKAQPLSLGLSTPEQLKIVGKVMRS
jgi:hypothetical protein